MGVWLSFTGLLFGAAALGALTEYSRNRLEKYCGPNHRDVLRRILAHDDDVGLAVRGWIRLLLFGLVVTSFFACWPGHRGVDDWWREWIIYLASIWLLLIALENWFARPLGENYAEPFLYWTWPVLSLSRLVMLPVLWIARVSGSILSIFSGRDEEASANFIHEEIRTVVNEGERDGQISGEAVDMIAGLMDLHEVHVSQIMTPRTDIIMLSATLTIEEARIEVIESGHSRIPVYRENRDDILGILYAKDLLPHLGKAHSETTLSSIPLRQPVFAQEDKTVDVLLRELRNGIHIAIVLDNYGGVAGLVTIEDVIEEIIGEIKDEYDEEESPPIRVIDEQTCEVYAWVDIDSINEHLSLNFPDGDDYDTIGGYVTSRIGRIPLAGETLVEGNTRLTVLEATDRAVERLRVERLLPQRESSSSSS